MLRTATSCNREQRRLALFLVLLIVGEVTLICMIINFEHRHAHEVHTKRLLLRNRSHLHQGRNETVSTQRSIILQILPEVVKGSEKYKWNSSTMIDFTSFGSEARKRAYETSRLGFKDSKTIQTRDIGLLKDNYVIPQKTRYKTDFRQPTIPLPELSYIMDVSQNSLRKSYGKRNASTAMVSEARHAFQWPSRDRIKLPLHLNTCKA